MSKAMTTETHLNENDIQRIIAERYGVHPDSVKIHFYTELAGYGINEREITRFKAVVITGEEENMFYESSEKN